MLCAGVEICVSEESDGGTSGQGVGALFRISQVYTMGNILKKILKKPYIIYVPRPFSTIQRWKPGYLAKTERLQDFLTAFGKTTQPPKPIDDTAATNYRHAQHPLPASLSLLLSHLIIQRGLIPKDIPRHIVARKSIRRRPSPQLLH